MEKCPVCLHESDEIMKKEANHLHISIECLRCGIFEFPRTAIASFHEPIIIDNYWKVSFWIKHRQYIEKPVKIDFHKLQTMIIENKIKMPKPYEQADNLELIRK